MQLVFGCVITKALSNIHLEVINVSTTKQHYTIKISPTINEANASLAQPCQ